VKAVEHIAGVLEKYGDAPSKVPEEAFHVFALAHLSEAAWLLRSGDDSVERAARKLKYKKSADGKLWGRPDDIGIYDCGKKKGASPPTSAKFTARYVRMYVEIRSRIEKKQGLKKTYDSLMRMAKSSKGAAKKHLQAIGEGMQEIGRCTDCNEGFVTCPQCQGKGIYDEKCPNCGGDGITNTERGPTGQLRHSWCRTCGAKGIRKKDKSCEKCGKTGRRKCDVCKAKGWAKYLPSSASIEDVVQRGPCSACGGAATRFRNTLYGCTACGGFGVKLIPTADPSATLDADGE
jgi:hypothetical protein